ncbi:MAG: hypothetical protein MUF71_12505 [Candidatus Kapabacteria bacterium]|jgi:hypothetical protein|nr:hypothetical protein [Candidatus Kapabacteria bacterium]
MNRFSFVEAVQASRRLEFTRALCSDFMNHLSRKVFANAKLFCGILLIVISCLLISCSTVQEISSSASPVDSFAKIASDLPKDAITQRAMTQIVYDTELKQDMVEFQNEFSASVRSANPAGLNTIELREAYRNNDIEKATKLLGISAKDLNNLELKYKLLTKKMQERYPEISEYAKKQMGSNTANQQSECASCNPDAAMGNIEKINSAILGSYMLKTKKFKGFPDIAYPENINNLYNLAAPGPGEVCDAERVIPLSLLCWMRTAACLIGANFTPPPFNIILMYVCFIEWNICQINALNCK